MLYGDGGYVGDGKRLEAYASGTGAVSSVTKLGGYTYLWRSFWLCCGTECRSKRGHCVLQLFYKIIYCITGRLNVRQPTKLNYIKFSSVRFILVASIDMP